MKKKIKLIITLVFAIFAMVNIAKADTRTLSKGEYCKGPGIWSYIGMHHYKLNNDDAFCLQWNNSTRAGDTYKSYTDANLTEGKRFIAGQIIEYIKTKSEYSDGEKYMVTSAALNTLFKMRGYRDFVSPLSTPENPILLYGDAITVGTERYRALELCSGTNNGNCLNNKNFSLSILGSNVAMDPSKTEENTWYSKKMTVNGMVSSFGGTGTSYVLTATGGTGICFTSSATGGCLSGDQGSGISVSGSTITMTNPSKSSYSFYVKVTGESNATKDITVSVKGSNSAIYPYVGIYVSSTNSANQAMAVQTYRTVKRYVYRDLILNVPEIPEETPENRKYVITARKYDENGVSLTGATYRLYVADKETGEEIKISPLFQPQYNSNGAAYLKFEKTVAVTQDTNPWLDYKYCMQETAAPTGYVYGSRAQEIVCHDPEEASACYETETNSKVENNYCDIPTFVCPNGYDKVDNGICNKSIEVTDENDVTSETFTDNEGITQNYAGFSYSCVGEKFEPVTNQDTGETTCELKDGYTLDDGETLPLPTATRTCAKPSFVKDGRCYVCPSNSSFSEDLGQCIVEVSVNTSLEEAEMIVDADSKGFKCNFNNEGVGSALNLKYCAAAIKRGFTKVTSQNGNLHFVKLNTRTSVTVSKKAITGDKELPGAALKICTDEPDKNGDCTVETITSTGQCSDTALENGTCENIGSTKMKNYVSWISSSSDRAINGLATGKPYYLVETVAPLGYKISTAIKFSLKADGSLVVGGKTSSDNNILVGNDLNSLSISKTDMASTKELPGAELKLCIAGIDETGEYQMAVDEEGNCIIPLLDDGTFASWTSTEEPHEVVGLPAGAYYLVESQAPLGYDVSESILFIMNQDGTISDKDGNIIGDDNKLVMHDKLIEQVPTGDILIGLVAFLGILGFAFGSYYYFDNNKKINDDKKVSA